MPRRVASKGSPMRRSSGSGGGCGSCITTLLTCAVLIGLAVFLAVYLTEAESPSDLLPEDFEIPDNFDPNVFIPSLEDFFMEDPYNATTPEDANRWKGTRGTGGLQLEMVNALDAEWYTFFDLAVQQWNAGSGAMKPLELSVSYAPTDEACSPIQGKMKVCNGNYGDTRWKGINVVTLINEEIIESSAKMNEFYLNGTSTKE